jgi:hypothetical protein
LAAARMLPCWAMATKARNWLYSTGVFAIRIEAILGTQQLEQTPLRRRRVVSIHHPRRFLRRDPEQVTEFGR